jgi:hypothetical protein
MKLLDFNLTSEDDSVRNCMVSILPQLARPLQQQIMDQENLSFFTHLLDPNLSISRKIILAFKASKEHIKLSKLHNTVFEMINIILNAPQNSILKGFNTASFISGFYSVFHDKTEQK